MYIVDSDYLTDYGWGVSALTGGWGWGTLCASWPGYQGNRKPSMLSRSSVHVQMSNSEQFTGLRSSLGKLIAGINIVPLYAGAGRLLDRLGDGDRKRVSGAGALS